MVTIRITRQVEVEPRSIPFILEEQLGKLQRPREIKAAASSHFRFSRETVPRGRFPSSELHSPLGELLGLKGDDWRRGRANPVFFRLSRLLKKPVLVGRKQARAGKSRGKGCRARNRKRKMLGVVANFATGTFSKAGLPRAF